MVPRAVPDLKGFYGREAVRSAPGCWGLRSISAGPHLSCFWRWCRTRSRGRDTHRERGGYFVALPTSSVRRSVSGPGLVDTIAGGGRSWGGTSGPSWHPSPDMPRQAVRPPRTTRTVARLISYPLYPVKCAPSHRVAGSPLAMPQTSLMVDCMPAKPVKSAATASSRPLGSTLR